MFVFKICAIAILVTIISLILKQNRPDISMLVTVAGGIILLIMIVRQMTSVFGWFDILATKTKLNSNIVSVLLKIVGIGYVAEFAATACEDAGNKSMAEKVALGAKIAILAMSIPILSNVIDTIVSVL